MVLQSAAASAGRLGFVAGLIPQEKLNGFERLLFRCAAAGLHSAGAAVGAGSYEYNAAEAMKQNAASRLQRALLVRLLHPLLSTPFNSGVAGGCGHLCSSSSSTPKAATTKFI
jgi:hypothetical protein